MVDHVRTLLLNPSDVPGYRHVQDDPSDTAMRLFGLAGDCNDAAVVDAILPMAMSADLSRFRRFFDARVTPPSVEETVYRHSYSSCGGCGSCVSLSLSGVYSRVLGSSGWWRINRLFQSDDDVARKNLTEMRDAAGSMDSSFALGAVLLACAYRRLLLQEGSV